MADMKAQTIILRDGDKTALQYLGAAVVLQWSNIPEDVRKSLLQQSDAVGGLPIIPDLHEQNPGAPSARPDRDIARAP